MLKLRSKKFALLLVITMLATMFMGVGTASASVSISAQEVKSIITGGNAVGIIVIKADNFDIAADSSITFTLPSKYTVNSVVADKAAVVGPPPVGEVLDGATADSANLKGENGLFVPEFVSGSNKNEYAYDSYEFTQDSDRAFTISLKNAATRQSDPGSVLLHVYLQDLTISSGADDCVVKYEGNGGFPKSGSVTVARVSSKGEITVTATEEETSDNVFNFILQVREEFPGSFKANSSEALTLKLPRGYKWDAVGTFTEKLEKQLKDAGTSVTFDKTGSSGRELIIKNNGGKTTAASGFDVELSFIVDDENDVKAGDIMAVLGGDTKLSSDTKNELLVGVYGSYESRVEMDSVVEVTAGAVDQEIGTIVVKEGIAGSLVEERTVIFTLPSFAKFERVDNTFTGDDISLKGSSMPGSDGHSIKFTVDGTSSDADTIDMENIKIAVDAVAPQDIKMTISGSAGIETKEVVIAKVVAPITITAVTAPDVKIGLANQKIGDIIITENYAGAIHEKTSETLGTPARADLVLKVPSGMEFAKIPKVEVTKGDLDVAIDNITRSKFVPGTTIMATDLFQYLIIPIDGESYTASEIKISDIFVTIERTAPEGNLLVAVLGKSVLESNMAYRSADCLVNTSLKYNVPDGLFPQTLAVGAAVGAKVITPAPGESKYTSVFTIGSTTFKLNGVDVTMDVAPYIKESRTFMPIRYVANALGVVDTNILWDDANKTVTLMKADKVVQLKIGSNVMLINGAAVTMDVAPEILNGRTMLPASWVAQAFAATATWDAAAQTVTINFL